MSGRFFWGSALLVVGLALLASNLGYIEPFNVWGLWPILIIWPALKILFKGAFITVGGTKKWTGFRLGAGLITRLVFLWVAVGAAAELLNNLALIPYDWGDMAYWSLPFLLAGIGLVLIFRPRRKNWGWNCCEADLAAEGGSVSSFVGDLSYGRRPWEFKSPVTVDLWAGDIDIDLTTARFGPGENHLYVEAWAGDVDIRAPEGIEVSVRASCSAGQIRIFGQHREGLGVSLSAARPAGDAAGPAGTGTEGAEAREASGADAADAAGETTERPRLYIDIDLTFGDVSVR